MKEIGVRILKSFLLILSVLFVFTVFVACNENADSPKEPEYEVEVPVFFEGNDVGSRIIDPRTLSVDPSLFEFYCYCPPFKGFESSKMTEESEVDTLIFGEPITLQMSLDSDDNYVFEGSNDSVFLKLTVSKDNKTFSFVHAISAINGDGWNIIVVVEGEGTINDSGYAGLSKVYFLSDQRGFGLTCQIYTQDEIGCTFFYHNQEGNPVPKPAEGYIATDYQQYLDESSVSTGEISEQGYYMTLWDVSDVHNVDVKPVIGSTNYDDEFEAAVKELLTSNEITDWMIYNPN